MRRRWIGSLPKRGLTHRTKVPGPGVWCLWGHAVIALAWKGRDTSPGRDHEEVARARRRHRRHHGRQQAAAAAGPSRVDRSPSSTRTTSTTTSRATCSSRSAGTTATRWCGPGTRSSPTASTWCSARSTGSSRTSNVVLPRRRPRAAATTTWSSPPARRPRPDQTPGHARARVAAQHLRLLHPRGRRGARRGARRASTAAGWSCTSPRCRSSARWRRWSSPSWPRPGCVSAASATGSSWST